MGKKKEQAGYGMIHHPSVRLVLMALPSPVVWRGLLSVSVKTVRLQTGLFLLMTILSQSFLTLVRSHLVAFSFLSAGHNN